MPKEEITVEKTIIQDGKIIYICNDGKRRSPHPQEPTYISIVTGTTCDFCSSIHVIEGTSHCKDCESLRKF